MFLTIAAPVGATVAAGIAVSGGGPSLPKDEVVVTVPIVAAGSGRGLKSLLQDVTAKREERGMID